MGSLFGPKSKSTSTSSNQSYDFIKNTFGNLTGLADQGSSAISALLGGDASGFNAYKNATGFDQLLEQGSRGVTGNAAANGLLRSGSTSKALANYSNTMQNQYADKYLRQLGNLAGMGFNAGSLISGAGNTSSQQSKSSDKSGLMGGIGSTLSAVAASDPRLKENIIKLGKLEDGLGVYEWSYLWDEPGVTNIGVMADEVEQLRPWAYAGEIGGYKHVNYANL